MPPEITRIPNPPLAENNPATDMWCSTIASTVEVRSSVRRFRAMVAQAPQNCGGQTAANHEDTFPYKR